jgi:hypothetical protein
LSILFMYTKFVLIKKNQFLNCVLIKKKLEMPKKIVITRKPKTKKTSRKVKPSRKTKKASRKGKVSRKPAKKYSKRLAKYSGPAVKTHWNQSIGESLVPRGASNGHTGVNWLGTETRFS